MTVPGCPWLSLAVLLRGSLETNESLPYPLDLGMVTSVVVASCLVAPRSQPSPLARYDGPQIASDRLSSTIIIRRSQATAARRAIVPNVEIFLGVQA